MSRRTLLLVGSLALLVLVLLGWFAFGLQQIVRTADRVMTYVPSEEDVLRSFPELKLPGSTFSGIWAERDRGTWIFDYQDADPAAARKRLMAALLASGWVMTESTHVGRKGDDHLRHSAAGAHLLLRKQPGGLRVLIVLSAEDDLAQDRFANHLLRQRWQGGSNGR